MAATWVRSRVLRAVAVDVVLVVLCWLESFTNQSAGWNRPFVLSVLALVALPLRRWSPEVALVVGVPALGWAQSTLAPAVLLFALGQRQVRASRVWLLAGLAFAVTVWPQWDPGLLSANVAVLLNEAVFIAGAVGLGALRRSWAVERCQRQAVESARARERFAVAEAARADERVHLAREMHDVVAHHVSLIAVQAGALKLTTHEERSREIAETVRALASATLNDLRQVLGVLRSPREGLSQQAGQSLADLHRLVQEAGSSVKLVVDRRLLAEGEGGAGVVVPAAVQGTVYRIVQEGLTNARKHAPGSPVRVAVTLSGRAHELQIDVDTRDAVKGQAGQVLPGSGLGLVGLRERATSVGGSVDVQTTSEGGHRLSARLPLQTQ